MEQSSCNYRGVVRRRRNLSNKQSLIAYKLRGGGWKTTFELQSQLLHASWSNNYVYNPRKNMNGIIAIFKANTWR